jgi:hypothetical protein
MADFESIAVVEKPTSLGGNIKVGIGHLLFEDGSEKPATAFEIKDGDGEVVAQFALLQESFGSMLEAIHELYSMFEEVEE